MKIRKLHQGWLLLLATLLIWGNVDGQPQVSTIDFKASSKKDCVPAVITFQAIGTDSSATIDWVIKNDTFPDREKLVKLFVRPGQYDITMLQKDSTGQIESRTKQSYVTIGEKPNDITVTPSETQLCDGPGKVTFNAQGQDIREWNWVIGNKSYPAAGQSVPHQFTTPGYKNVTLRAVNDLGCTAAKSFDSILFIEAPIQPEFEASQENGFSPHETDFEPQINRQDIQHYEWTFPGANSLQSKTENPQSITYSQSGNYDVSLAVTTEKGCEYQTTKQELIQVADSIDLDFQASSDRVCPNEPFQLINQSGQKGPGTFHWELNGPEKKQKQGNQPRVILEKPGIYDVTMTYKVKGLEQSITREDVVKVKNLEAGFSATPPCNCKTPTKVEFKNETSSPHSGNTQYEWTMWDKNGSKVLHQSQEKNPAHIYQSYGNYDVRLVSKHDNGCIDTAFKEQFIKLQPFKSNLNLNFETQAVNTPLQLAFPEDSFCSKDSLRVVWTVYNNDKSKLVKISNERNPYITFQDSGDYKIKLSVSTKNGCKAQSTSSGSKGDMNVVTPQVGVSNPKDTAEKPAPYQSICSGETVTLEENTTPKVLNYKHKWTITHQDKSHVRDTGWGETYAAQLDTPGIYDVYYQAYVDSINAFDTLRKGFIRVHGTQAGFSQNVMEHCLPKQSTVEAQIDSTNSYPANVSRRFQWSTPAKKGVTLNTPGQSKTSVTLDKAGNYPLSLTIRDTMGCESTMKAPDFLKGGLRADFNLDAHGCFGEQKVLKNQSFTSDREIQYQWQSPDQALKFLNGPMEKDQKIGFKDSGLFEVQLSMEDQYGCRDTLSQSIHVEKIALDFSAADTLHRCAPAIVDFQTEAGDNVQSFHWSFGDGLSQKTRDAKLSHAYNKNSGNRNSGFDVALKAQTEHGCQKTVQKSSYITVIGPVPDFETSTQQGCEPLNVSFEKTGKNYTQAFMDYDDRSNIDTATQFQNTYHVKGHKTPYKTYKPIMVAKDSMDCYAIKEADKPIKVYQKPKARFALNTVKGCEPKTIQFTDQTSLLTSNEWDFNNDGKTEVTAGDAEHTYHKGTYDIRMMAESDRGCRDTVLKTQVLEVLETPKPNFTSTDPVICPESAVTFTDETQIDEVPLQKIAWHLETSNGTDTITGNTHPEKVYPDAGKYDVRLKVVNEKGCEAIKTQKAYVHSLDKIDEKPALHFVSGEAGNTGTREIQWERSKAKGFKAYHILEDADNQKGNRTVVEKRSKTTLKRSAQAGPNAREPQFRMTIEGQCGFFTDTTEAHQMARLTVESDSVFTNDLRWKPYKGWEKVDAYQILRSQKGTTFRPIARVDGAQPFYRDQGLCREQYCYKVVAINELQGFKSLSSQVCQVPDYQSPRISSLVQNTTVKDGAIETQWKAPHRWDPDYYRIDRKIKGKQGWTIGYAQTEALTFRDPNVHPNQKAYQYRVRAANHCGELSNQSNPGTSIRLRAGISQNQISLDWNGYEGWESRAREYAVQVNKGEEEFETIATVPGHQTSYTDASIHETVDTAYEYRVIAKGPKDQKSFSNTASAVMPSRVFMPNAFSPNKDGLNDEFRLVGNSIDNFESSDIRNFEMTIYNKWGEQIFKSNKLENGWDGTDQSGNEVSLGSYLYKIRAHGLDGKAYFLQGQVQVVR